MSEAHSDPMMASRSRVLLGAAILAFGFVLIPLNWQVWAMVNAQYQAISQGDTQTPGTGRSAPAAFAAASAGSATDGLQASSVGAADRPADEDQHTLLWFDLNADLDTSLLALVMVSSVTGSYVHLATSFGTYVGNRRLRRSWIWWYLNRISIGLALALVFYFAIRGGLLSVTADAEQINPYGIAAVAGLVGLFSKQATDKLRESFDVVFRTGSGYGDDERQDKASNPVPTVAGLEPAVATAGTLDELRAVVRGQAFLRESVVRINGRPIEGAFVDSTQLAVVVPSTLLTQPGNLILTVTNPEPGGGESNAVTLRVEAA